MWENGILVHCYPHLKRWERNQKYIEGTGLGRGCGAWYPKFKGEERTRNHWTVHSPNRTIKGSFIKEENNTSQKLCSKCCSWRYWLSFRWCSDQNWLKAFCVSSNWTNNLSRKNKKGHVISVHFHRLMQITPMFWVRVTNCDDLLTLKPMSPMTFSWFSWFPYFPFFNQDTLSTRQKPQMQLPCFKMCPR